jgi:hypothetical protein
MDNGVLLETKKLVELIRHYIREQMRVFSVFHPCEWHTKFENFLFCHSNIKSISLHNRLISYIYFRWCFQYIQISLYLHPRGVYVFIRYFICCLCVCLSHDNMKNIKRIRNENLWKKWKLHKDKFVKFWLKRLSSPFCICAYFVYIFCVKQ